MRINGCRNAYSARGVNRTWSTSSRVDQLVDNRIDLQAGQQIAVEAGADDRRGRKRVFGGRAEPVDARGDGCLQSGGHADVGHIDVAGVTAAPTEKDATFGEFTGDLLGEKGVSGRAPGDDVADLANGWIGAQQLSDQRRRFRLVQGRQGDGLRAGDMRESLRDIRGDR